MLNWPRLVSQGRAKDIGIAWNQEELKALYELKIPAEYVRDGILTTEAYEKASAKDEAGGKPDARKNRAELEAKATGLGVEFAPEATDSALKAAIKAAEEAAAAAASGANAPEGGPASGSAPTRAELEAKATALKIEFGPRTQDATLIKKIEEAETKA